MLCINTLSNHPPHTIKHLPTLINERFSQNSLNEEIFNRSKELQKNKQKNRRRNVILLKPSFNKDVSTNVSKRFQNLIAKHFPKDNYLKTLTQ